MIGIFVALLSGALMSIQGVFNTEVTRQSSVWVSASWVQFSDAVGIFPVHRYVSSCKSAFHHRWNLYGRQWCCKETA